MIRVKEVNVIGANGEPLGVFPIHQALALAQEVNYDLVEVAPTAVPPVCRIMDYGKFKYKQSKKAHEAKKNQKVVHVKEVKFRPNTDQHDFEFKLKHVQRFLEAGDKAKVQIFFKGREILHREHGEKILQRIVAATDEYAVVEQTPRQEGRALVMILAPKGKKKASHKHENEAEHEAEYDLGQALELNPTMELSEEME